MTDSTLHANSPANLQRRKLLQGTAAALAVGVAPALSAATDINATTLKLTGELVCDIADPVKTLVLRNHSDQPVAVDHMSNSALMFDGSIVDCNNAFVAKRVTVPANGEVRVRFPKRHPSSLVHAVEDYQRVQPRVTRLSDGTRVIPFTATVRGGSAKFV